MLLRMKGKVGRCIFARIWHYLDIGKHEVRTMLEIAAGIYQLISGI